MSRPLRAYVTATVLAAVAVLAIGWPHAFARDWGHYVAWIVICLVSETMWSNTISGAATWSLSATAGLSTRCCGAPGAGIWIAALSTLIADLFVLRKPLGARGVQRRADRDHDLPWARGCSRCSAAAQALPVGAGGAMLDRAHATVAHAAVRRAVRRLPGRQPRAGGGGGGVVHGPRLPPGAARGLVLRGARSRWTRPRSCSRRSW